MVETNHLPHLITLIVNDTFYNDLSQEDRQIMDEAAANATAYAREMSDQRIEEKKEQIRKSGTQIIELDENTRNEIREKAQPVYDQIKESIEPSLFKAYTQ